MTLPSGASSLPAPSLVHGPRNAHAVAAAIAQGIVLSCHDCSEGGLLVAAAEMAFSGGLGLSLNPLAAPTVGDVSFLARCFAEDASRYLIEVDASQLDALSKTLAGVPHAVVGTFDGTGKFSVTDGTAPAQVLSSTLGERWSGGLSW